jgi:RNA polymerase sigma-70 factor (ECF subfamily)
LLRRLREGSETAATQLYQRYAQRLQGLAQARTPRDLSRCLDADDIVQSVFSSFFRGVSQGYYDVPAGEELWNLLLVIALNKIRAKGNYHRAAKRDIRLTAAEQRPEDCSGEELATDSSALTILEMVIAEILERLPDAQQQMITLRLQGFEVAEIAQQTGRSKRSVERILQDFRKQLAKALHGEM